MKILIDIGHPADFHLFKNLANKLIENNHSVIFTIREKDILIDLIKNTEFKYISYGKNFKSIIGKIFGLFLFNLKLLKIAIKFRPDIFLSHSSMYAAQVSFLLRKKSITLEDTGNKEQIRLYKAFSDAIITSECLKNQIGKKQIRINSYHELAYLHPKYFTPNKKLLSPLNIKEGEKIILIRFVARNASHDIGLKGINVLQKERIINKLSEFGRVLVSSEVPLPESLQRYLLDLPVNHIHHLIAFSNIVFCESATMVSEAAVLGVPSIYLDPIGRDYTDELGKKYQLVYNYKNTDNDINLAILKASEILNNTSSPEIYKTRQAKMLNDKINFTDYLIDFVENFQKI